MASDLETGEVGNTSVKANRDGDNDVRMMACEVSSPGDVQSVQLVSIGGMDFHPLPGARVMVAQVGNAWKMAIVLEDGVTPTAAAGEKFIYSQDSGGAISALVKLRNTGDVEINGDADWAVAYTDLKMAFDQLKSDHDTHVHLAGPPLGAVLDSVGGPCTGPTAPPTAGPSADMSPAKVSTVKLP